MINENRESRGFIFASGMTIDCNKLKTRHNIFQRIFNMGKTHAFEDLGRAGKLGGRLAETENKTKRVKERDFCVVVYSRKLDGENFLC